MYCSVAECFTYWLTKREHYGAHEVYIYHFEFQRNVKKDQEENTVLSTRKIPRTISLAMINKVAILPPKLPQ